MRLNYTNSKLVIVHDDKSLIDDRQYTTDCTMFEELNLIFYCWIEI